MAPLTGMWIIPATGPAATMALSTGLSSDEQSAFESTGEIPGD